MDNKVVKVVLPSGEESSYDAFIVEHLSKAQELNLPLYFLVTGAIVPETGKSWCPDCTAADPYIENALNQYGGYLVTSPVERSTYKGQPQQNCGDNGCTIIKHPYKVHNKLNITNIPTLFKISYDNEKYKKLVERDICNIENINTFFNE